MMDEQFVAAWEFSDSLEAVPDLLFELTGERISVQDCLDLEDYYREQGVRLKIMGTVWSGV